MLSHFLERNSLLLLSQSSYRRGLKTCDACSHRLTSTGCFAQGMEGWLVQLYFLAVFDTVGHCSLYLLYKLRSVGVGGQLLFLVSEFLSDRRQRVRLDGKVCV